MNARTTRLRKATLGVGTAGLLLLGLIIAPSSASADPDPSQLSGTVTDINGAVLGDGVTVDILDADSSEVVDQVQTDTTTGAWSADEPDGAYRIEFVPASSHYRSGYFGTSGTEVLDPGNSPAVVLPTDGLVDPMTLDTKLHDRGAATGQVVDSDGHGIPNVTVDLLSVNDFTTVEYTGTTDSEGNYTVWVDNTDHSDQPFFLIRYSTADGNYQAQYSGGVTSPQADGVSYATISDDSPAQPTVTLLAATSITGTVTGPDGDPVEGASVYATDEIGNAPSGSATTDADGEYRIAGLGASEYSVQITADGYYFGGGDPLEADLTTNGAAVVDAQLSANGVISGIVTDSSGAGINGAGVEVVDAEGNDVGDAFTANDGTDDGAWDISMLPYGTYTIRFTPPQDNPNNLVEGESDVVILSKDHHIATKNWTLGAGASISGTVTTVTDSTNQPGQVDVIAESTTSDYWRVVSVDPTKAGVATPYTINGLPAGTYKIDFDPQDYLTLADEWWKGAFSEDTATVVTVTAGHATTGINDTVVKQIQSADFYVKTPSSDHVDVGQTLSVAAHKGTVAIPKTPTLSYQWVRLTGTGDDEVITNIPKATKSTYKTVNADAGTTVGVIVTQTAKGYAPWVSDYFTFAQVGNATFTSKATFKLSGTAATGHTLTVSSKGSFNVPVQINYYWSMAGLRVPNSWSTRSDSTTPTSDGFTALNDPNGATNTLFLGWDDLGNGNPYDASWGQNPPQSALKVAGDATISEDAGNSVGDPSSHDYPFQFHQLLFPEFNRQKVAVEVCAEALDGFHKTYCTTLKAKVASDIMHRVIPVVSKNGSAFSASVGVWHSSTWTTGKVGLKYQWLADGAPIAGATKTSYTATAAQSGETITIRVTGTASGYTTGTAVSLDTYTAP